MPQNTAERFVPSENRWLPAGRMARTRQGHSATLLSDSRVLVVGGSRGAELYDPETNGWSKLPGTHAWRRHTATLLADGRVLLVGGQNAKKAPAAAILDARSGESAPTFPPKERRYGHTATRLRDGTVLVVGGWSSARKWGPSTGCARFDPSAGTWSQCGTLQHARANHTATLLPDGRVAVIGGRIERGIKARVAVSEVEVYDPAIDAWTSVGALAHGPGERYRHFAVRLGDGRLLIGAGQRPQVGQSPPPALASAATLRVARRR